MVGFDDGSETRRFLNETPDDEPTGALERARPVEGINANLTHGPDLTKARRLGENLGMSFMGVTKVGPFDITEASAMRMLNQPNPHGKSNREVIRPWVIGMDITRRPRNVWIIDFGDMPEAEAALYEAPFDYVREHVKPERDRNRRAHRREFWWHHGETVPGMRKALARLNRYVATPNLTKYRFFVWLPVKVLPDHQLIVFARDDDYFFGVLHSRPHEIWARGTGTQLREATSGFRYTPTSCFETFPFPQPTPEQEESVAAAAKELNSLREQWLNPASVDGLPLSKDELKKRTLTNLYNQRPTWLANVHSALDAAVLAAYGWPPDIGDADILSRLLALNLQRKPA